MSTKPQIVLLFSLSLFLFVDAQGGIIDILKPLASFSTFTDILSKTKIADEIDKRQTITVLVLDNKAVAPITSLSGDAQKYAISVHVLLDYYDPYIFDKIKEKTALITTLFQTSGVAGNSMGFLNYTQKADENMVLKSAESGATIESTVMKVVAARPYNVSVLQISSAIVPPGLDKAGTSNSPTQAQSPSASSPSSSSKAPSSSPASVVIQPPRKAAGAPMGSAVAPKSSSNAGSPNSNSPKSSSATPAISPAASDATSPSTLSPVSSMSTTDTSNSPTSSVTTPSGSPKASSVVSPASAPADSVSGPSIASGPTSGSAATPVGSADSVDDSAGSEGPVSGDSISSAPMASTAGPTAAGPSADGADVADNMSSSAGKMSVVGSALVGVVAFRVAVLIAV